MTREQALENALRPFVLAATRPSEHRVTQMEVEIAQAALTFPPDSVNADMLAALRDVANAYQQHFDVMPVAWQTIDHIVSAAIARATS